MVHSVLQARWCIWLQRILAAAAAACSRCFLSHPAPTEQAGVAGHLKHHHSSSPVPYIIPSVPGSWWNCVSVTFSVVNTFKLPMLTYFPVPPTAWMVCCMLPSISLESTDLPYSGRTLVMSTMFENQSGHIQSPYLRTGLPLGVFYANQSKALDVCGSFDPFPNSLMKTCLAEMLVYTIKLSCDLERYNWPTQSNRYLWSAWAQIFST